MPIARYLAALQAEAARGVATEHTFRPALKTLLEALNTGIAATNEPRRIACGAPDYQITHGPLPVGHIEAKDLHIDLDKEQRSAQMARYLKALPNLILTNYLEFRWFVNGELRETALFAQRNRVGKLIPDPQGEQALARLLQGFLAQQPPIIATPRELALRLAELARLTRSLIAETFKREGERGELHEQYDAFRKALIPGLDADEFADMYAQTLAYGLFAARVAQPGTGSFARHSAAALLPRTNPFLRKLFYEIAGPDLDDRIAWAVDDIATLLERADMSAILRDFGKRTRQEDPVVHFYETFLAAYDPRLRESRGVYYTPEPVVSFIVRSVDQILRTRFSKTLGLADQDTLILDPATGTATFLYFVIEHIYETLQQQGLSSGWNSYVGGEPDGDSKSLLKRLFGFELLMAPYAVAHLKLGLQLKEKGYSFQGKQRLGVYLTNALDEGVQAQTRMAFARYIAEENEAAAEVKSSKPIMVVLGNPPYSGHSENKGDFIRGLINDYMRVDAAPLGERNPKWLQDDYVKFIRFGQWRIDQTGEGVLAYISNNGYLDNPTFRGMRQSLMRSFDDIYILNLHGNSNKRERAPDGSPDDNVFDIKQGVAIALFIKSHTQRSAEASIYYADLWGLREGKYTTLAESDIGSIAWQTLAPSTPFYLFIPQNVDLREEYERGWKITACLERNVLGFQTHRDEIAIAQSEVSLLHQVESYLQRQPDPEEWITYKRKIDYRPFDRRIGYLSREVTDRPRLDMTSHMFQTNIALNLVRQTKAQEWHHALMAENPTPAVFLEIKDGSSFFPLYLYPSTEQANQQTSLFDAAHNEHGGPGGRRANLSPEFISDLSAKLGLAWQPDGRGDLQRTIGPEDVFHYAYAIFHSPTYRSRYAEFLKIDFPRLPLTSDPALFRDLAALGADLVDLHLLRLPGAQPADAVGGQGGAAALVNLRTRFVGTGTNLVEKVSYDASKQRVQINATQAFEGIDPDTWAFRIGGYQVLDKWLKDRKGRTLSFDDLLHYQRVVIALMETRRIMAAIDQRIPGWPLA